MARSVTLLVAIAGHLIGCGDDAAAAGESSTVSDDSTETGDQPPSPSDPLAPLPEFRPPSCDFTEHPLPLDIGSVVAAGDFDGDGHADLLTLEREALDPATLRVWLGDGAGGLSPGAGLLLEYSLSGDTGLIVGDVDSDGVDEFAYHDHHSGRYGGVWVHEFEAGGVTPGTFTELSTLWSFRRLIDTNDDGFADLSFGGYHSTPARLFLGDGLASFVAHAEMPPAACYVQDGDWADVDQNGELDLLLVDGCNGTREQTWVSIYTQHDGSFERRADSPQTVPWDPLFVRAGEFDGEPGLDLVTQSLDDNLPIVIHHGHGDGSFASPKDVGGLPFRFSLRERADLDDDGLDDLLAHSHSFGVIRLRNLGGGDFEPCVIEAQRFQLLASLDAGGAPSIITVADDNGAQSSWQP